MKGLLTHDCVKTKCLALVFNEAMLLESWFQGCYALAHDKGERMFKKYLAKKTAKKGASWMAKKEAQILFTALATIGTQKVLQKASKKYPSLSFLQSK